MSKMIEIRGDHPQGLALCTRIWLMQSLGEQFGKVSYCKKPPTTGDPNTDVAWVAFDSNEDAEKAVAALKIGITLSTTWQNVTINIKGDWKPGGGGGGSYNKSGGGGGAGAKGGRHWQDEDVETSRDLLLRKSGRGDHRDDRRSRSRRRSSRSRSRGGYADRDRRDYRSSGRDDKYSTRTERRNDSRSRRDDSRSRRDDRDDRRKRTKSRSRAPSDDRDRRDDSRKSSRTRSRSRKKSRSRKRSRSRSHSTGKAPGDDRSKDKRDGNASNKRRSAAAETLLSELKKHQTASVMEQLEVMQREEFQSLPIEALLHFIIEKADKKTPLHEQVARFLDSSG
eukprot:TRINITY_DN3868_c0_g2_i1.p1 TRINITY_DN3868_c0_g2~~TRINITY_DN3868_c0_g2_i1.p1  ORF type:complete len:338 (-),score=32.87 TRINITY_DN3868_c0_g2_i1:45-1058(-)